MGTSPGRSILWNWLCSESVHLFATQDLKIGSSVFSVFCFFLNEISPERLDILNSFFCMAVLQHDWRLVNKFWSLMAFGILCRYSLKSNLFFRNQNINMQTWTIEMSTPKVTYIHYMNSFFTFEKSTPGVDKLFLELVRYRT